MPPRQGALPVASQAGQGSFLMAGSLEGRDKGQNDSTLFVQPFASATSPPSRLPSRQSRASGEESADHGETTEAMLAVPVEAGRAGRALGPMPARSSAGRQVCGEHLHLHHGRPSRNRWGTIRAGAPPWSSGQWAVGSGQWGGTRRVTHARQALSHPASLGRTPAPGPRSPVPKALGDGPVVVRRHGAVGRGQAGDP